MGLLDPTPVPYDPLVWEAKPFADKATMVCQAWALQGYGTPPAAFALYAAKIALFIGGWLGCCAFSAELGGPSTIARWWAEPLALQKAVLFSALFEVLGFGCGSGPLTGRYYPPLGGFLYFLRPGTTKAPWVGGTRRTFVDVALYATLVGALGVALVVDDPSSASLVALGALAMAGVRDRTVVLAARAEHYAVAMLVFVMTDEPFAALKLLWCALWFFAGLSKLNRHFPYVVCVMTSNSPVLRAQWLRRRMYRNFPCDLRPSWLAVVMAHLGTGLELGVPCVLAFGDGGAVTFVGLSMMLVLHTYITTNVPMGVPLEWNVTVVYGALVLFGAHASVGLADVPSPMALAVVATSAYALPIVGNLFPASISFLWSMRYYAGNWAYSVWLFRKGSEHKFEALEKSSPWIDEQLGRFYDRPTAVALFGKVMAFRLMHLHGRALGKLLPRAVERIEDYAWVDGEIVAGLALGWNFGDGHLHDERLLRAVQRQCGFEEGELRCIFVESQPLGRRSLGWRIADAANGPIASGRLDVRDLESRQPWELDAAPGPSTG